MARTPLRNLRIDDDTWTHWQAVAADLNVSVSALIMESVDRRLAELSRPGPARNGATIHVPERQARAVRCVHGNQPRTFCSRGCD